jgi:hypothetical protein
MKAVAIEAKLNELRADPEAIGWSDRIRLVGNLLGECSPARPLDGHTAELARLLAADPKWEVRMALANHLHKLSETDFASFTAVLTEDDNAFVKSAAEIGVENFSGIFNPSRLLVRSQIGCGNAGGQG